MAGLYTAHAACSQSLANSKHRCQRPVQHHGTWSVNSLPPALTAAVNMLQLHPRLAGAAPAALSSTSTVSSCSCSIFHERDQHQQLAMSLQARHSSQQQRMQQVQQRCWQPPSLQLHCLPESAADAAASAGLEADTGAAASSMTDAAPAAGPVTDAAAALTRLQQLSQKLQSQTSISSRELSSNSSSSRGGGSSKDGELQKPLRPAVDHTAAQQQQQQQAPARQDRLLSWRTRRGAAAATPAAQQQQQQQLRREEGLPQPQAPATQPQHVQQLQQPLEQQQQQQGEGAIPALEPSFVGGRAYLTSPVSVVAATTPTKALAGSISAAFVQHSHQLMFAVGPQALGAAVKALATARGMLAANNNGQPVNILMQPTLRGKTARSHSYALDVTLVGQLPLQPGVAGVQQLPAAAAANAKVIHITTTSNELAAAQNLVDNMPARGQTIIRVAGPYATETAVLAVALARPLMRQRWGQDLAVLVMWHESQVYKGSTTGLLLSVFRCTSGSFPPEVLLQPPSQRSQKRQQYWQQRQQRRRQQQQQGSAEQEQVEQ